MQKFKSNSHLKFLKTQKRTQKDSFNEAIIYTRTITHALIQAAKININEREDGEMVRKKLEYPVFTPPLVHMRKGVNKRGVQALFWNVIQNSDRKQEESEVIPPLWNYKFGRIPSSPVHRNNRIQRHMDHWQAQTKVVFLGLESIIYKNMQHCDIVESKWESEIWDIFKYEEKFEGSTQNVSHKGHFSVYLLLKIRYQ